MHCEQCSRLERQLLEARVFEDRAQTALRCYFTTHRNVFGVGDMDEYLALRNEVQRAEEQRHESFIAYANHQRDHHPSIFNSREAVEAQTLS